MLDRRAQVTVVAALAATACFHDTGGALTSKGSTDAGTASTSTPSTGPPGTTSSATTGDPSSTSGTTSTTEPAATTGPGTTSTGPTTGSSTGSTTGPPPGLPACAFADDFADAEISTGKWFVDNLTDPFTQGNAYFDVGEGSFGLRQGEEFVELVDCVTSVKFAFTLLSAGSAFFVSIELAGAPSDPGDDDNAVLITYTPDEGGYTRADVHVAGVPTAFAPMGYDGTPSGFRIVRWGAQIIPGVRIGGDWKDFEPLPMPDYPDGEQFRMVKLAVHSNNMNKFSFDDVNLP